MSSPSSRMRPAEGRNTPVSRLITVVLPAPLGPIRAWRAPFSICSETRFTAATPPKCFSRSTVSSTTGMSASFARHVLAAFAGKRRRVGNGARRDPARDLLGKRAQAVGPQADALAPDEHDQDQHQADPELPILRG